ncbi:MAG: (d)CMP kinase [Flavobacteriales bacterium]|nr:(d)CMP kinase [Flavobacteriales bacterium]
MKKINIAIDGHSSCGKSTIAKQLSNHLGYIYIDTGAMYRAICLYALRNNIISDGIIDEELLFDKLDDVSVSFEYDGANNQCQTFLDGQNVESVIRGLWVSENVSKISKIKAVRQKMISIQREIGRNKGVVMDGRDIGSVVFPNAELKLFVTASVQERARRRSLELKDVSFEDVIKNLKDRDEDDSTRKENPLIVSENAIVIDNTNMTKEEQFEKVLEAYENAILN